MTLMTFEESFREGQKKWTDVEDQMPEEDITVLVYLDCYQICLGRWMDEQWDIEAAPWEGGFMEDDPEVLKWRYLPWQDLE